MLAISSAISRNVQTTVRHLRHSKNFRMFSPGVHTPTTFAPSAKFDKVQNLLDGRPIGVIGGGNIGQLVVRDLINQGFPAEKITVSIGGSPATRQKLSDLGVESSNIVTDNQHVADNCGVVVLAIRPQQSEILADVEFSEDSKLVSMMAGVPISAIEDLTEVYNTPGEEPSVIRALTCGHDLIDHGNGLIAFHPPPPAEISQLYNDLGSYTALPHMPEEKHCDMFFSLVVLPAVMVACHYKGVKYSLEEAKRAVASFTEEELDFLPSLYAWAAEVHEPLRYSPDSGSSGEEYLGKMFTKGGITEAEVTTILNGGSFEDAIKAGYAKCQELQEASSSVQKEEKRIAA